MSYVRQAVDFFKANGLTSHIENENGYKILVVPFPSKELYDEFHSTIGRHLKYPIKFVNQTKELRILFYY